MLNQVRALLTERGHELPECIVCRRPVRPGEDRLKVRGDVQVHRACATYRMRNLRAGRFGYRPR